MHLLVAPADSTSKCKSTIYLVKVLVPLYQSRCQSTLVIDLHWSFTDFGAEE